MTRTTILHLSDIQYGRHHVDKDARPPLYKTEDYSPQSENLCDDLEILKKQGVKPEIIVVSGDIAEWSMKEEYALAEKFLDIILKYLGIDRRFVAMVPGNHDVNRKLCAGARMMAEGNGEILPKPYYPKFKNYETFFNNFYKDVKFPTSVPPCKFCEENLFVNFCFPEHQIVFAGLNSCIDENESDVEKDHYGNITVEQVKRACAEIDSFDPNRHWRRVALMHHNFVRGSAEDNENLKDAEELTPILIEKGFSLIFHGHEHMAQQKVTGRGNDLIHVLATGSAGLDGKTIPNNARRYQIIQIEGSQVRVYRRFFDSQESGISGKGCWKPDMRSAQTQIYEEFYLKDRVSSISDDKGKTEEKISGPLLIPEGYKNWINKSCGKLDISQFRMQSRIISVDLPELFLPLYAMPPNRKKSADYADERRLHREEARIMEEREQPEDIEKMLWEYPCLLMEGQAGSGKTTLMKYLAYTLINSQAETEKPLLPVLIFLRDMKGLETEFRDRPPTSATLEAILCRYFQEYGMGLDTETVRNFCSRNRAVLLIDGLDECDPLFRDMLAVALADFRQKNREVRTLLSGRPHGIQGKVTEHFGEKLIRILSLNPGQVNTFVKKWFCHVETQDQACVKSADELLAEMESHPYVDKLKETPLMLTAICMLYYDGGELPGQRAELYDKFITCLLKRRFTETEKKYRFLMLLALDMHKKRELGAGLHQALEILSSVYIRNSDESEELYRLRLEKEFERIEQNCGLLLAQRGHYAFWHKTFQEFLTAAALVSRERENYGAAIRDFWQDDWYHETVALYIAFLSLRNDGMAVKIVQEIMEEKEEIPFTRRRLCAKSFNDIHPVIREREGEINDLVCCRLLEIIETGSEAKERADAGETLGRLGDPRNLKEFVKIPGGKYKLKGPPLEKGDTGGFQIEAFEISKYPVSNSWYKEFVDDKGYEKPELWTPEGRKWLEYTKEKVPLLWYDRKWNCPNAPVVGVCWWEAAAFANWLTKTSEKGYRYFLPHEKQWEAAAAGAEGREYPWGKDITPDHCNYDKSGIDKTSSVGIFPKGNTPEGLCDMAGNVWDWMGSDYNSEKAVEDFPFDAEVQELFLKNDFMEAWELYQKKYEIYPVLRGGSWTFPDNVRCADRSRGIPDNRSANRGFRVISLSQ